MRLTCLGVQDVVEGAELHVLTNDDQVRRLGTGTQHRQDVRVVEDSVREVRLMKEDLVHNLTSLFDFSVQIIHWSYPQT